MTNTTAPATLTVWDLSETTAANQYPAFLSNVIRAVAAETFSGGIEAKLAAADVRRLADIIDRPNVATAYNTDKAVAMLRAFADEMDRAARPAVHTDAKLAELAASSFAGSRRRAEILARLDSPADRDEAVSRMYGLMNRVGGARPSDFLQYAVEDILRGREEYRTDLERAEIAAAEERAARGVEVASPVRITSTGVECWCESSDQECASPECRNR